MNDRKRTLPLKNIPADVRTYIYIKQAELLKSCHEECNKLSLDKVVYRLLRNMPDFPKDTAA